MPKSVSLLSNLTSLNLSENREIRRLPLELGNLKDLDVRGPFDLASYSYCTPLFLSKYLAENHRSAQPLPSGRRAIRSRAVAGNRSSTRRHARRRRELESRSTIRRRSKRIGKDDARLQTHRSNAAGVRRPRLEDNRMAVSPFAHFLSRLYIISFLPTRAFSFAGISSRSERIAVSCWEFESASRSRLLQQCFYTSRAIYLVIKIKIMMNQRRLA